MTRAARVAAPPATLPAVLAELESLGSRPNILGRARFGIQDRSGYGVSVPALRRLARRLRPDHRLARELWQQGSLDARLLAAMIDDPTQVTRRQMERWASAFDSWALCDGCCQELFRRTDRAWPTALAWTARSEEYVKRAGFALIAELALHDAPAPDARFLEALERVRLAAGDDRRYVRKGANWALRQIGKRNLRLRGAAIRTARRIQRIDAPSARWIASDALRELLARPAPPRRRRPAPRGITSRRARPGSPSPRSRSAARNSPRAPKRRADARP